MLTFSRLTPVLLTSACRRAMVWFSLSKYELSGEPARLPLRLSEAMSPERKPLSLPRPSLHCGFASEDTPNASRTSEISWMNSSLLGNWGRSSGSSIKWLSISTKQRLAWRVQELFHYKYWSMRLHNRNFCKRSGTMWYHWLSSTNKPMVLSWDLYTHIIMLKKRTRFDNFIHLQTGTNRNAH